MTLNRSAYNSSVKCCHGHLGGLRLLIVEGTKHIKAFIPKIQVLKLIDELEIIRAFDLVSYLAMTQKAAETRIYRLQKAGLIEPLGPERGQWVLSVKGYLGRNPCELVDPPSPRKKPMRTLTPSELEVLLGHASSNQFYPVIYTTVSTGLRQAELLGLMWRSIDLDYLSISVNQVLYKRRGVCQFNEPKTSHSRRRVSMTPKLALFLREYKLERERLYQQLGKELTLDSLVFANVEGKPLDPGVLTHNFARIAKRAGLENVRFHDLRHTFASLMLLRGAKPKVISEALGHSSVAFTMDVYSHIIKGMQEDAMALLDEVLPAAVNKNSVANLSPTF